MWLVVILQIPRVEVDEGVADCPLWGAVIEQSC